MVFPQTMQLERLADKLAAMTELKESTEEVKPPTPMKEDPVWEKRLQEIGQSVPELNAIGSPDLIRSVYTAGIRDVEVLKSLAALSLTKSQEGQQNYDQHILTLAQYLAQCSPVPVRKCSKLALIRTLMTLRSPMEVSWQLREVVVEDTLRFITDRQYVWEYLDHFDEVLLWELRAITLREMEHRSDRVAGYISRQAVRVERGLSLSTDVFNAGLEGAGAKLKQVLEPEKTPLLDDSNQALLAYSEKAKRTTDTMRLSSHNALVQIQSTSAKGIHTIANRIQEVGVGERVIPNEESRRVLCAVGKVGIASVGAAALVADTMLASTGQVAKKTAAVTADVVEHKYGRRAGILMRNANDTAGNIARTLGHVALLHKGKAMTKSVAKATGKAHVQQINEQSLVDDFESESSSSIESHMFGKVHDDMFGDEIKEVFAEELPSETAAEAAHDGVESPVASSNEESELTCSDSKSNAIVLQGSNSDFDTRIDMSPSELDSCLPDQITGMDAQSDFFSDITSEPLYEKTRNCSTLLNHVSASRNSIFRNVDDTLSTIEGAEDCYKRGKHASSDDDSLNFTACTMEETYLTNNTSCDQQEDALPQQDFNADNASIVSGFEKHYEPLGTGSEVSVSVPEKVDFKQANRIPLNGYVLSDTGMKKETWPKGLYSSVKFKLGLPT